MPDFNQDRQAIGVNGAGGVLPAHVPLSALGRNFDLVFVVLAAAVALALRAPALGVLVGAGGWLAQRALAAADRRLIVRFAEPGSRLGLNFVDAFARIWLLAGAIVIAYLAGGRHDGLAAALLILATYSVAFAVRIGRGRPEVDKQ
ncbi:MAG TPA: hypothetical protein VGX51_08255 [Solirubrobacteraceae bacterium]|jgi:hypothetical protein|nr:hypothetical protein [Solirubrobacteraceae bacterium]